MSAPDIRVSRWLLATALLLSVLLFRVWDGQGVDETGYHTWLTSVVWDGDLDQSNDRLDAALEPDFLLTGFTQTTDVGFHAAEFSVGPAFVRGAALAPLALAERALLGAWHWRQVDRFALRWRLIVSLISLAAGLHALLLLHHTLRLFFSRGVSAASAALAVFGSPLLVYMETLPAMAHALGFWAVTVLLWLSVRRWREGPGCAGGRDWALGLALGLAVLIRWPAAVWVVIPAAVCARELLAAGNRLRVVGAAATALAGALAVVSLQLIVWRAVFGQWLLIPQGQAFLSPADHPLALAQVLFARWNGLVATHPWTAVALVGTVLWAKRVPLLGIPALLGLLGIWVINAAARDWWAGTSFGARRWIEALPVLAFGWAAALAALPSGRVRWFLGGGLTLLFTAANLAMATLWSRGVILEDWWGHRGLLPVIGRAVLSAPLEWIEGDVVSFGLRNGQFGGRPIALLLLLLATMGAVGWTARGGRCPWPRPPLARWLTIAVSAWLGIALAAVLWAAGRGAPHAASHVALRDALRASRLPADQWRLISAADFPFDPDCPVHLAAFGGLALRCGDAERGLAALRSLEKRHPRLAWLLTLQHTQDPAEHRRAQHLLLADARRGHPVVLSHLMVSASEVGDAALLGRLAAGPGVPRGLCLRARARTAQAVRNGQLEEEILQRLRTREPQDLWTAMRLADLAAARGDTARSDTVRAEIRRWIDVEMSSIEHLQQLDAEGIHWNRQARMADLAHAAITVCDPITEAALFEGSVQRATRLLRGTRRWPEFQRQVLNRRWSAARAAGPGEALGQQIAAIETIAAEMPDTPEGSVALVELRALQGDWQGAMRALGEGVAAHPAGSDWAALALRAAQSLGPEALAALRAEDLPPAALGIAAWAVAQRATDLGEWSLAWRWSRRAREAGLTGSRIDLLENHLRARAPGGDGEGPVVP